MCTASWKADGSRFDLCFNRDERKSRSEAIPPRLVRKGNVSILAPIDPDGGGTWLAVNEFGLCVYLLNNYAADSVRLTRPQTKKSRGELPLLLAGERNRESATKLMGNSRFENYDPFIMVIADPLGVEAFSWSGEELSPQPTESSLFTTSSVRTIEVEAYRRQRYLGLLGGDRKMTEEGRRAYHTELAHSESAFNPMMLREDSKTHSFSTVSVDPISVTFRYETVKAETRNLEAALVCEIPLAKNC